MRKVTKILLSVLSGLVLAVIILPVIAALLLNVEGIQNFAVRKAGEIITRNLGTTVSMESIKIRGFSRVEADGFYVEDLRGDTLLYAGKLSANLSKTAILRKNIVIGDIKYSGGKIYLYTPAQGQMNIQDVLDTFVDRGRENTGKTNILLRDILITETCFKMQREGADTVSPGALNYNNMVLENLSIGSHNLHIDGRKISMNLYGMSFTDIGGLRIDDMGVEEFVIDQGLLDFRNTRIVTPDSRIAIPQIRLDGNGDWKKFKDFTNNVRMSVSILKSSIHTRTLGYFVPALGQNINVDLDNVTLTFEGTVNDFSGKIYDISSAGTHLHGTYAVRGVADMSSAFFDIDIPSLTTDPLGLEALVAGLGMERSDSSILRVTRLAGDVSARINVQGSMEEFDAEALLTTAIGDVEAKAKAGISGDNSFGFDGDIAVTQLDAGGVSGAKILGKTTARARARGTVGGGLVSVNGNVEIPLVEINGYPLTNIRASGGYDNGYLNGRLSSPDRNLRLNLAGSADLRRDVPAFDLTLDLRHADLYLLGFNKRDSISVLSANVVARGSGSDLDDLNGTVRIEDLSYESSLEKVTADSLVVTGRNSPGSKFLSLESEFADARFVSEMSYKDIMDYVSHILFDYLPALDNMGIAGGRHAVPQQVHDTPARGSSRLNIDIKKANNVASIFLPGFSIAEGSHMEADFNPVTEKFTVAASSDYVEYANFLVTKLQLAADNTNAGDSLRFGFSSRDLYLPGYTLPFSTVTGTAKDDSFAVSVSLSDQETDTNAHLEVQGTIESRSGKPIINGTFGPSWLVAGNQKWEIYDSGISYGDSKLGINDFRILNNGQGLYADGVVSRSRGDTLQVKLADLDISPLSALVPKSGYRVEGMLNGFADISSLLNLPLIMANVRFEDIVVNGTKAVPLQFTSKWDFETERATLFLSGTNDGREYVKGYYRPSDNAYMGEIRIPGLPLSLIDPLLSGAVENTGGTADIELDVRSDKGAPFATGTIRLNRMATTVDFNKATYRLPQAVISVKNNVAELGPVELLDSENNRAELSAHLDMRNLSNISYSARLIPRNIIALNTGLRDNDVFYGKVYASGAINLSGNKMGVNVDIVASTENNSFFGLPLAGKSSVSRTDFIIFESAAETSGEEDEDILTRKKLIYERRMREVTDTRASTDIDMTLNVRPNTEVSLILDQEANNSINARGNASLNLHINPGNNDFTMSGIYEITEGEFILNVPGIFNNRRFNIEPGGTIQWTGEPIDAMLDITAAYRLRASIEPIMNEIGASDSADPTSGSRTSAGRIPIDCIVKVSGHLSQPDIRFEVNAPNATADIQSRLSTLMSTQEMMAQQFVWLMLMGSFYDSNNTGGDNFNIGSASTSVGIEFLTSNLSNIVSGISDIADFTFRIRPQDAYSSSEFDIGFTTDIIANRLSLEVEGNINTGDNETAVNQNNLSGDASLTGTLNKSGTIRGKVFTRTRTTERFDEYQGLQESGIGIYYRENFNRFSDVIDRARSRSQRRKQNRADKRAAKEAVRPEETGNDGPEAGSGE